MCSKMLGSNHKLLKSISQSRKHIFWLFTRHDSSKIDDFIDIVGLEGGGGHPKTAFSPQIFIFLSILTSEISKSMFFGARNPMPSFLHRSEQVLTSFWGSVIFKIRFFRIEVFSYNLT